MKKLTILIVLTISMTLFTPKVLAKRTINIDEKSFATPETAIIYFMESLKNNELDKAFTACDINNSSKKYNFSAFVKRANCISYQQFMAPTESNLYTEINKIESLAKISKQIKLLYYCVLSGRGDLFMIGANPEDAEVEEFIQAVNPKRLSSLEVVSIDKHSLVDSERYHENSLGIAKCFGASDVTERVALLKFNDDYYILGFQLYQYGSSWKINSLSSPISKTPFLGIEKISLDEYKYRLIAPPGR